MGLRQLASVIDTAPLVGNPSLHPLQVIQVDTDKANIFETPICGALRSFVSVEFGLADVVVGYTKAII